MQLETSIVSLNLRPARETGKSLTETEQELRLNVGTSSDAGRVRDNNEDSFLVAPELNLFILSDGMGGLACGEVASRLTVETVLACYRETRADSSLRLVNAIQSANRVVYQAARESAAHREMGATIVALHYMNGHMSIAHVGDSRAYRLRGDCLEQLTQDHSFVAEQLQLGTMSQQQADTSNLRNVLTRAVGIEPEIHVDLREELVMDGDTFLLCSDGLTGELSDEQISAILHDATDAHEAADQLVHFANEAGGGDNVTAIVVRQHPRARSGFRNIRRMGRWLGGLRNQS